MKEIYPGTHHQHQAMEPSTPYEAAHQTVLYCSWSISRMKNALLCSVTQRATQRTYGLMLGQPAVLLRSGTWGGQLTKYFLSESSFASELGK